MPLWQRDYAEKKEKREKLRIQNIMKNVTGEFLSNFQPSSNSLKQCSTMPFFVLFHMPKTIILSLSCSGY